ncbi:EAL domain-containing protein [Fulvimarina sp. MAC8]|uniref:putative bifunctional diguanylate cyclase/phosphodiesterase n=1 Tax=Fulvimarina sp. MAC8 TaxID=3162874 RepID=UPI0032EEFF58
MKTFWRWITIRSINPEMAVAQVGELQRQIPLLYSLLSVNALALAYTHYQVAPTAMTIWLPALLVGACLVRMTAWVLLRTTITDPAKATRVLRRTTLLAFILAVAYVAWALKMNDYGGDQHHGHVAIFIAITVIGCIFCLMHLPQAAFLVTLVVIVPYVVFYTSIGNPTYTSIAMNIFFVTLVVSRVLANNFDGFSKLIEAQLAADRLNREITAIAHTDLLTGLPNRRQFFADLEAREKTALRADRPLSMGVIDLDHFKAANDTFGHILGDELLAAVGERLRDNLPEGASAARFGGDEFAFLIHCDGSEALAVARRLCAALSEPYALDHTMVTIGASCGVAGLDMVRHFDRSLYDCADYALYNAKSERRGIAVLYEAELDDRVRSDQAVEAALHSGDLETEMHMVFQPIFRLNDDSVVAVEALARWTSPKLGRVAPDHFVRIAERAGMMHRLTLMLFRKTLHAAELLPSTTHISFNLSAHDVVSSETILGLISAARNSKIDPQQLIFELTETAILRDFETATASLETLRRLGCCIALDDFGTGHSSLNYLGKLPIEKVKIDRSFISQIGDPSGERILSAIIGLCDSLGLDCIAEGVEEAGQLKFLRDNHCQHVQGYLYSKPLDVEQLIKTQFAAIGDCRVRA